MIWLWPNQARLYHIIVHHQLCALVDPGSEPILEAAHRRQLLTAAADASADVYKLRAEAKKACDHCSNGAKKGLPSTRNKCR